MRQKYTRPYTIYNETMSNVREQITLNKYHKIPFPLNQIFIQQCDMFAPFIKAVFEANDPTKTNNNNKKRTQQKKIIFRILCRFGRSLHSAPDEQLFTYIQRCGLYAVVSRTLGRMLSSYICCFGWGSKGRCWRTDAAPLPSPFLCQNLLDAMPMRGGGGASDQEHFNV